MPVKPAKCGLFHAYQNAFTIKYAFMHETSYRPLAKICQDQYCVYIQYPQGAKHEPSTLPHTQTEKFLRACGPPPAKLDRLSPGAKDSVGGGIQARR